MKKLLLLLFVLPSIVHADRLGGLLSDADVLLTTQSIAGSGDAILAATQTWTGANTYTSSVTLNGPLLARDSVGTLGQVIVSMGEGQAPMFVDPIVSQSNPELLKASVYIAGSSNTVQITGTPSVNVANSIAGNVSVTPGTGTFPVSGSVNTTSVSVSTVIVQSSALPSGAATSALQTQPGVDIGDVTINNGTGGSAVNIQDGGNSITVDGSVTATGSLAVTAGTGTFPVTGTVGVSGITNSVTVTPGTGTYPVSGSLAVTAGTGTFPVSTVNVSTVNNSIAISTTGFLNAVGSEVILSVGQYENASFNLGTLGYTGTVYAFFSADGGVNWSTGAFSFSDANSGVSNFFNFVGSSSTFIYSFVGGPGMTHVKLRCTAFTFGTATATISATHFGQNTVVSNAVRVTDNGGSLTVDGTVSAAQSGTWTINDSYRQPAVLSISTTGIVNQVITASVTAAGSGLYNYITAFEIIAYSTGVKVAAATPTVCTTTNFMSNPSFTLPTGFAAGGTQYQLLYQPSSPMKTLLINSGGTISCPATTQIIWRINVFYFTGT